VPTVASPVPIPFSDIIERWGGPFGLDDLNRPISPKFHHSVRSILPFLILQVFWQERHVDIYWRTLSASGWSTSYRPRWHCTGRRRVRVTTTREGPIRYGLLNDISFSFSRFHYHSGLGVWFPVIYDREWEEEYTILDYIEEASTIQACQRADLQEVAPGSGISFPRPTIPTGEIWKQYWHPIRSNTDHFFIYGFLHFTSDNFGGQVTSVIPTFEGKGGLHHTFDPVNRWGVTGAIVIILMIPFWMTISLSTLRPAVPHLSYDGDHIVSGGRRHSRPWWVYSGLTGGWGTSASDQGPIRHLHSSILISTFDPIPVPDQADHLTSQPGRGAGWPVPIHFGDLAWWP